MQNYNPGNNWSLFWADEFDGDTIDDTKWTYQQEKAGRFNEEWQHYTNSSENAYVENSCLVIKATHDGGEHAPGRYRSARMHTAHKFNFQYGKIAASIKLPYGKGIWPAFWMLGANIDENGGDTLWPFTGEIDILELYGTTDNALVEANVHYANPAGEHTMSGPEGYHLKEGKFADNFHLFELEWDAKGLKWSVDGHEYYSHDLTDEQFYMFHQDFFMLLNIAVGGTYAGHPDETTPFPQYMFVDWIRVYKKG